MVTDECIDPFSFSVDSLKRNMVVGILSSYAQPWDLLAELIQNSLDAIRRWERQYRDQYPGRQHFLIIKIDSISKTIEITDSGIGFDVSNIGTLLSLSGTDKTKRKGEVGEKGVGLKFAVFSSDSFELKTTSYNGHYVGVMNGAMSWLCDEDNLESPSFITVESSNVSQDPQTTGTKLKIGSISRYDTVNHCRDMTFYESKDCLFNWSSKLIEYVLRTKTGIGSTKVPFGIDELEDLKVVLKHVTEEGEKELEIKYGYKYPMEVDGRRVLDYDYIKEKSATWSDKQRISHLKGRCMVFRYKKSILVGGQPREFRGLAFWVPKTSTWTDIQTTIDSAMGQSDDSIKDKLLPSSGIYVSVKGMPTGVPLSPPDRLGNSIWLKNVLFVVDVDHIDFDIGRKSIGNRSSPFFKEFVREMFNKMVPYGKFINEGKAVVHGPAIKKEAQFEIIDKYPDLGFELIPYMKDPNRQEAAVVAIFHEMLGAGIIKGYHGMQWSYQDTYDFYAYYDVPLDEHHMGINMVMQWKDKFASGHFQQRVVMEFKYAAEDVILNVVSEEKSFSDIDLIVCWNINITRFQQMGHEVDIIESDDVLYNSSSYEIRVSSEYGGKSIAVIVLSELIEDIKKENMKKQK